MTNQFESPTGDQLEEEATLPATFQQLLQTAHEIAGRDATATEAFTVIKEGIRRDQSAMVQGSAVSDHVMQMYRHHIALLRQFIELNDRQAA